MTDNKLYYQENKERLKAKSKARYAEKREEIKKAAAEYRKTPAGIATTQRHHAKVQSDPERREHRNDLSRQRYSNNNEYRRVLGRVHQAKRRVRLASNINQEGDLKQFIAMSLKADAKCAYCGEWLLVAGGSVDHMMPVSRGGTNTRENLCLCCLPCNKSKGNKTIQEWRQ
jgi:5-methylcytosine-specific restriction endonuclease McrA